MKTKLIKTSLIIIPGILVAGVLYWYLNYQFIKTAIMPSLEETTELEETTKTEEAGDESIKSIPLEKPPFIK